MPLNSKLKGKRGELEFAEFLRQNGFPSARRGRQYSGGPDSPDIVCEDLDNFHFEVKNREKLNFYEALQQAYKDSGQDRHRTPVVVHKKNRSDWHVFMAAFHFLSLVKKLAEYEKQE